MTAYRTSGHAIWDIKYHLIWITKYRYKVLRGEVAERARDVIRQICQAREVTIMHGAVSPDHVHILVSAPPLLAPPKFVQYVKGKSSRRLQEDFPHLRKRYWGQHLWARGYFCATVARWTRRRSWSRSRIRNGTKTRRLSRLPRPPSLEPACIREPLRRLPAATWLL